MRHALLAIALLVCWVSPAAAQEPPEQPPEHRGPAPRVAPRRTEAAPRATGDATATPAPAPAPVVLEPRDRGLLANLGFGITGCTDRECEPLYPMVHLRVHALYRIFKYLAVGLHVSFNFFHPGAPSGTKASSWQLHLAPEARGLYSWRRFDFWTALTLGYVRDMAKAKTGDLESKSWEHGFGLGWGLGAQYYLLSQVAVGVDFWLYKGAYGRRCVDDASADEEVCEVVPLADQGSIGITWALGVSGTFFWSL